MLKVIAVDSGSPGDMLGLQVGDEILSFNGYDCSMPANWYLSLWSSSHKESIPIAYRRGDIEYNGELITAAPRFPYLTLIGVLLCILTYATSLIIYLRKRNDPIVRIVYLAGCCSCLAYIIVFNVSVILKPAGAFGFIAIFLLPLHLRFSLIFPEHKQFVKHHSYIFVLIYIPVIIWLIAAGIPVLHLIFSYLTGQHYSNPNISQFTIKMAKYLIVMILCYFSTIFVCLSHTFFTTNSQETKRQLKWLLYGGGIAISLGYLGCFEFFSSDDLIKLHIVGGRIIPIPWIISFVLLFFSLTIAVYKYKLMDIDIIIHQSLTYILVSGATLILYILIFGVLSRFFEIVSGQNTFVVYALSALIVAFIFRPLINQVEQRIDQIFFSEKYTLQKSLETLLHALTSARDIKIIFENIFKTVEQTLHVEKGTLWLVDETGDTLEEFCNIPDNNKNTNNINNRTIQVDHPFVMMLSELKKGIASHQIKEDRKITEAERVCYLQIFQENGTVIFLPLIYENSLLGLIGFGKKRTGNLFSSSEVGMLTILAHQAAVAMENARAYQQIKKLNKKMNEKVHHIEQQHNEILVLQKQLLNENSYLREEMKLQFNFEEIVGSSPKMKQIFEVIEKVAPTNSTVLIRGESGTGKELIARAVHFNSPRRNLPFLKVNCGAIPGNLLESELFGHEKGSFTGAISQKQGKFEMASGGSIFLDEIGELEPDLQVKLLRVLQEREFERVGGNKTLKIDVRVIAATNRDIEAAMSKKTFREDLFYRLNVITITLPPLRDRDGDIRELTIHFIKKFSAQLNKSIYDIDPEAMRILKSYSWPGNVRELANIIERAMVLGEGETLSAKDLPQNLLPTKTSRTSRAKNKNFVREIKELEIQRIIDALDQANGNKSEAARMLGMKRTTLTSKLKRFNNT